VNDELGEVERTLPALVPRLRAGGRIVAITFHSVEDRAVKRAFKRLAGGCVCEGAPCVCPREALVESLLKKPLEPSDDELRRNPRARSAKLRCVEKL